jgi:GDP/UDP-N,N'-diacetylbacillosamine 2-epimerase (hydrolysing)
MRKVCYVTGTRADYGLMRSTLHALDVHPDINLSLMVTGMHLLQDYGETWKEIETDKLCIEAKVYVDLSGASGAEMSIALGQQVVGFTNSLRNIKPDLLMLLGDRGEMLAGAIAALHLNIPCVHIHGGELSGTIDESVRHAISKLSHYHFTATEKSRERLIRMGEQEKHIFVTGAPGLDEIQQTDLLKCSSLLEKYGIDSAQPFSLVVFHPVVQHAEEAAEQVTSLLDAVLESGVQSLVIMPNADAGGSVIARVIREYEKNDLINTAVHVPRREFLSLIACSQVMVGNSSSGIIEAASLDTPVVNVGNRQNCRERSLNVIDAVPTTSAIAEAISAAKKMSGQSWVNVYGDGDAARIIVDHLLTISLSPDILDKVNAY